MPQQVTGVWFRKCLRLHDNHALLAAAERADDQVLPFFILDLEQFHTSRFSANRFSFLLETLRDLDAHLLKKYGSRLCVFHGTAEEVIGGLCGGGSGAASSSKTSVEKVFGVKLDRLYREHDAGPGARARDARADEVCQKAGVEVRKFVGHTILDLDQVAERIKQKKYKPPTSMAMIQNIAKLETGSASPDKLDKIPHPKPPPTKLGRLPDPVVKAFAKVNNKAGKKTPSPCIPAVAELYPGDPPHPLSLQQFPGGETEGLKRLEKNVAASGKKDYVCDFKKPMTSSTNVKNEWTTPSTTGLSPYLMLGCLSPRQVWHAIQKQYDKAAPNQHSKPPMSLHGQLLFREMMYVLSAAIPNFDRPSDNEMCKDVWWSGGASNRNGSVLTQPVAKQNLLAWQEGRTGYPYIDALMRQLKTTGWMHHLGRHAVACFLTRGDLFLNWTHGRDWFDKQLLDGDQAINNGNWLWLAGTAPYSPPWFRVYSPVPPVTGKQSALNAEQTGEFVKYWVPELKNMPAKYIYEPWKAPILVQQSVAKCVIGQDYPDRIVDHATASKQNIESFKKSVEDLKAGRKPVAGEKGAAGKKRPSESGERGAAGKKRKTG